MIATYSRIHRAKFRSRSHSGSVCSVYILVPCTSSVPKTSVKNQTKREREPSEKQGSEKKSIKTIRFSSKIHFHRRRENYLFFRGVFPFASHLGNTIRLLTFLWSPLDRAANDIANSSRNNQQEETVERGGTSEKHPAKERVERNQFPSVRNYIHSRAKHGFPDYAAPNYR